MKEKELIKGKAYDIKKIVIIISIVIIIIGLIVYSKIAFDCYKQDIESYNCEEIERLNRYYNHYFNHYGAMDSCDEKFGVYWVRNLFFSSYGIMLASTLVPLGIIIVMMIVYWWLKSMEINVTDKRVYGKAAFGRIVNLPLDSISAVALSFFRGISISTSSNRIKFKIIKNNKEVYDVITELLIKRQKDNNSMKEKKNFNYIEELKELKELLDNGVINQSEFEEKKKELLK